MVKNGQEQADDAISSVAQALGVSETAARLHIAAGVPGTLPLYGSVRTQAEVGRAFNVSERTVRTWCAAGAPGRTGFYGLPQIGFWRRSRSDGNGTPALPYRAATGELFRAACRFFGGEIKSRTMSAADEFAAFCKHVGADDESAAVLQAAFETAVIKHMEPIIFDEPTIEALLAECWRLV